MKKRDYFWSLLTIAMVVTLSIGFTSCSKDDKDDELEQTENVSNQDPEGTIVLNMLSGSDGNYYKIGELGEIHVDAANNFRGWDKSSEYKIEFVTIGKVEGLGKINNIPISGWAESAAVVPGTGYMMRYTRNYWDGYNNNRIQYYARIYVVDYLTTATTDEFGYTSGGNSGATIKYQAPLQQIISLDSNSMVFPNQGGRKSLNLKYSTHLNIMKKPEWCSVEVYMDSVVVSVGGNTDKERNGEIVLSNLIGEATVSIAQGAVEPIEFEKTSLSFTSESSVQGIKLKSPTTIKLVEAPNWCEVETTEDSVYIKVYENMSASNRTGKVEFENAVSAANINIIQQASSSPLFEKGMGTIEEPYQIKDAQQLENIGKSPSSHFVLINDIDLKNHLYEYGNGWEPIVEFYGTLDGKGHTIKNLWIKRPSTSNVGLFGSISNATITNIKLEISEVGIKGSSIVGGISGRITDSSITNSSVSGIIMGNSQIGGLCGVFSGGTIKSCSVSGTITGSSSVGGLCGAANSTMSIDECKSEGTITSSKGLVAGIVGQPNGGTCNIANCYSVASLSGYYCDGISHGGNHTRCYFAGKVSTYYSFSCGGTYTYFDSTVSGQSGSNGYSTEDMMKQATYESWDFKNIWKITEGKTYPTLRCFDK